MSRTPPPRRKTPPPRKAPAADAVTKAVATNSGSNTEHSILGPSYSKTWLTCAAAIAMAVGIKDESGMAAMRGTVMHYVGEMCINHGINDGFDCSAADPMTYKGCKPMDSVLNRQRKLGEADIVFDQDMVDATRLYVGVAHQLIERDNAVIWMEERAELTALLGLTDFEYTTTDKDGNEVQTVGLPVFGTGDLCALVPLGDLNDHRWRMVTGDYKSGRNTVYAEGEPGSRSGNPQLMLYTGGLLPVMRERLAKIDPEGEIVECELMIIAPYMGFPEGKDTFTVTPEAVDIFMRHAATRARAAAECLKKGKKNLRGTDFKPTVGGCEWCKARDVCGVRNRLVTEELRRAMDEPAVPVTVQPAPRKAPPPRKTKPAPPRKKSGASGDDATVETEMSPEEITAAYAMIPLMKQQIKVAETAMHRLMFVTTAKGGEVKDWKIVTGSGGNREWTDPDAAAAVLKGARCRDDEIYSTKIISPKQAETLMAGKPRVIAKLKALMTQPDKKPVIAPKSDKRPEWKPAQASDLSFD